MNESIDVLAVLREYRELRANTQGAVMGEFDGSLARIDAACSAVAELIDKVDSVLTLGWSDTAARELRAALARVGGAS